MNPETNSYYHCIPRQKWHNLILLGDFLNMLKRVNRVTVSKKETAVQEEKENHITIFKVKAKRVAAWISHNLKVETY